LGAKIFSRRTKARHQGRLKDKVMFGSDYPSIPYDRLFKEWKELAYSDEVMEKNFSSKR